MPRKNRKTSSSNGHQNISTKKTKDKPTYKIIVLGSGGVGKVRCFFHDCITSFRVIVYNDTLTAEKRTDQIIFELYVINKIITFLSKSALVYNKT